MRVQHSDGMSLSRDEYADYESVHWYEVLNWGNGRVFENELELPGEEVGLLWEKRKVSKEEHAGGRR